MIDRFDVLIVDIKMLVSIVITDNFGGSLEAIKDHHSY